MQEMGVRSLVQEDSSGEGNGNPHQYSCLENPLGQRSLVGYRPWGCKESDLTEYTQTHINPRSRHSGKYRQNMPPSTPNKSLFPGPGKGQPSKTETLWTATTLSTVHSCTGFWSEPRHAWMWLTGAAPGLDYPTTWALESVICYNFSTDCRTGNASEFSGKEYHLVRNQKQKGKFCASKPSGPSQVKAKSLPRPSQGGGSWVRAVRRRDWWSPDGIC